MCEGDGHENVQDSRHIPGHKPAKAAGNTAAALLAAVWYKPAKAAGKTVAALRAAVWY